MSFKHGFLMMVLFSCFSSLGMAESEKLIISNCLFDKLKDKVSLLAQADSFSLIETELNDELLQRMHDNRLACGKFLNLEVYSNNASYKKLDPLHLLTKVTQKKVVSNINLLPISHDEQVQQLYKLIDPNKIWQTNQHLTSYINRSSKTNTGIAAAHWFKRHFDAIAHEYGRDDAASTFLSTGTRYKQPSVIAVIGKGKTEDALVIGAHIDTLNGSMPGADDDASGISVALEIARVLLSSDLRLDRPVYLIAYAAEENGLVGSSFTVKSFLEKKIPVKAVMQLDQSGFRANPTDKTIWLMKDYVDKKLTQFIAELLTHYVQVPVAYTKCGYACSDHVSWSREGFNVCYPSGTAVDNDNPYMHTSEDKLEILNLEHMVHFTKLGLAFVVELGLK